MKLKDRLLNKLADKLKKYGTPEYDYILSCNIKGEVKSAFMTTDCSTIKELTDKSQKGMIDISKLLDDEFKDSEGKVKKIIFCDRENVICLYNSKNNTYYESVHEFFDNAEERTYIKCDSDSIYQTFKNFILQSSKYHDLIDFEYDIPRKKAFDNIFSNNEQNYYATESENSDAYSDDFVKDEISENNLIQSKELER